MIRFATMLHEHLSTRACDCVTLAPEESSLTRSLRRLSFRRSEKWLGYFDKYLLFPPRMRRRIDREVSDSGSHETIVHIADHSNALYVPNVPTVPWIVTCHDLLAVRGALGEDTDCPASRLGRQLQQQILRGLQRASAVACDSTSTAKDLDRLAPSNRQPRRMIPLGLNHTFKPVDSVEATRRLGSLDSRLATRQPWLLHVGSNLSRKNKIGVYRIFARLAANWSGLLVFAGAELPAEVANRAGVDGLADRVVALPNLTNEELEAVYSQAHALLFPSTCEGFGWPIIEAQACGCPVVCSDRTSLPEVAGPHACIHPVDNETGMARSLQDLEKPELRRAHVDAGFANLKRFDARLMVDAYEQLYQETLSCFQRS